MLAIIAQCFIFVHVLSTKFDVIVGSQSTEKIRYENSLDEFAALLDTRTKLTDTPIKIQTGDENRRSEISRLAGNLSDHMMEKNDITNPIEKSILRKVRSVLVELRDFIYSIETVCLKNITKIDHDEALFPSLTTITRVNDAKHSRRWKSFFDKCHHEQFLPIKDKVGTTWDSEVFSEQTDVLILLTEMDKSAHLRGQWYMKQDFSKDTLLSTLKTHTKFNGEFITFVDMLYDIMTGFYDRWITELKSKN